MRAIAVSSAQDMTNEATETWLLASGDVLGLERSLAACCESRNEDRVRSLGGAAGVCRIFRSGRGGLMGIALVLNDEGNLVPPEHHHWKRRSCGPAAVSRPSRGRPKAIPSGIRPAFTTTDGRLLL